MYKSFSVENQSFKCLKAIYNIVPDDFPLIKSQRSLEAGKLELDFYLPKTDPKGKPVIAYIHGGGWRGGDRSIISVNYYGGYPAFLLERGHIVVALSYSK